MRTSDLQSPNSEHCAVKSIHVHPKSTLTCKAGNSATYGLNMTLPSILYFDNRYRL